MTISIRVDKSFNKIHPSHIARVKTDFYKGAAEMLPFVIKEVISKGISPVKGVGRFQKYSQSYSDQIMGKVTFRMIRGRAVPFRSEDKTAYSIRKGKTSKNSLRTGANSKISVKKFQTSENKFRNDFIKFGRKKRSPVNMSLTNEMMNSLNTKATSEYTDIFFTDKKAAYHNDEGVGKSKVIRPLLPTKSGQRFSDLINKKLMDLLRNLLGFE